MVVSGKFEVDMIPQDDAEFPAGCMLIAKSYSGAFTLRHEGKVDNEGQSLEINILAGLGSGVLANISGTMTINQNAKDHEYEMTYKFA